MRTDFLPRKDDELNAWATAMATQLAGTGSGTACRRRWCRWTRLRGAAGVRGGAGGGRRTGAADGRDRGREKNISRDGNRGTAGGGGGAGDAGGVGRRANRTGDQGAQTRADPRGGADRSAARADRVGGRKYDRIHVVRHRERPLNRRAWRARCFSPTSARRPRRRSNSGSVAETSRAAAARSTSSAARRPACGVWCTAYWCNPRGEHGPAGTPVCINLPGGELLLSSTLRAA